MHRFQFDPVSFWRNKWKVWGFTLMETMIVVIMLAVLVSLGVPSYNRAVERARDREAITNLRLIQSAEMIYHSENNVYYPAPSGSTEDLIANINSFLHLNLNEQQWDYQLSTFDRIAPAPNGFQAQAFRQAPTGGFGNYTVDDQSTVPTCIGTCP